MLRIKKHQFEKLKFSYFCNQLRDYFENESDQAKPSNEIIEMGVKKAERFGLIKIAEVIRLIEYLVLYGEEFADSHKTLWAYAILTDKSLNGNEKLNKIDLYDLYIVKLGKKDVVL